MIRDLYHNAEAIHSLLPAARTASANGSGVDLDGFESALVLIEVGARTDGTHTFEVQESDDNSTFTAVADGDLQGSEPVVDGADDASQVHEIGYTGDQRYLRVAVTVAGATTGAVYGATIVRSHPHLAPVR